MNLNDIYEKINTCEKCSLHKNRKVDYIWRGNPGAKIFFIGEAPGKNEQLQGIPFVGRSGKLLDKILLEVGIDSNKDVFISNLVKCRPKDNRKPFYDEIVVCSSFLLEEIQSVRPKLIITLGKTAGDWFSLYKEYKINEYLEERRWLPLYHPSDLLKKRNEIENFKNALKGTVNEITK